MRVGWVIWTCRSSECIMASAKKRLLRTLIAADLTVAEWDMVEQRPTNRRLRKVKRKPGSEVHQANGGLGQAEIAISSSQTGPASLLAELKQAHEALLGAMDAVDRLTLGLVPDKDELTSLRWDLSKASLSRRMLWGKILTSLSRGLGGDQTAALRRLQELDISLLRASTHHVSKWTTEAVLANWSGYCAASRSIRRKMAANIDAEKRLLYPMLQSAGRASAARSMVSGPSLDQLSG